MRICKVEGCNNKHFAKEYCCKHYQQITRLGYLLIKIIKKCEICGSTHKVSIYKKDKLLCSKHQIQMRIHGKIINRTRFNKNEIIDCGDYYEICLYGKENRGVEQKEIARTKIDKEDLKKVKNYKWSLNNGRDIVKKKYAIDGKYIVNGRYVVNVKNRLFLHRLIMDDKIKNKRKLQIDHIDHDILNNRKQNLRVVTNSQNNWNKDSKGYCWDKSKNNWIVGICINYKKIYLGRFINEQDAITARREAEQKYFGEFAYQRH